MPLDRASLGPLRSFLTPSPTLALPLLRGRLSPARPASSAHRSCNALFGKLAAAGLFGATLTPPHASSSLPPPPPGLGGALVCARF